MKRTNANNNRNVGIAVQADWENRQYSNAWSLNVHHLFEFLLQFDKHPTDWKYRLAVLNEKLTKHEARLEFLEAKKTKRGRSI
ncbi:hypothetical protein O6H91_02G097000 [Diphasiastrum complanatum]|uniref:Uncharacterized protein n=1 Tax=Diphasiastrum complanatum TaxID=34168 RepID=A0ACC2EI91_DIPCM|nr:hypothetical protein O6H91_02G097000 [Diphasiastrum complanatum]